MHRNSLRFRLRICQEKARMFISLLQTVANPVLFYRNPLDAFRFQSASFLSRKFWYALISLLTCLSIVVSYSPRALTQVGAPFACDRTLYITQGPAGQATTLNRVATSPFSLTPVRTPAQTEPEYNAIGFNLQDGYIYGISPTSPAIIYRIDSTGTATPLVNPPAPPTGFPVIPGGSFAFAGDIRRDGRYFVYLIDLPAPQPNLFEINLATNAVVSSIRANGRFSDISFNPTDNQLYAIENTNLQLVRIDVNTGITTPVGAQLPGDPVNEVVGAAFFNAFGDFFAYRSNGVGNIFAIRDVANINATNPARIDQVGTLDSVQRFDGASCAFAPDLRKIVEPTSVPAGGTVTYRYRIANQTISSLTNLVFRDVMPDGRTFVDGTLNNPFGGNPNPYGGNSTLEITGITLPTQTNAELTVQVRVPLNTTPGTVLNQATVSPVPSNSNNPNLLSDFPTTGAFPAPTPLQVTAAPPTPRIGLAKRVAAQENIGGGNFRVTYELLVRNTGNVDLNNVQIIENLTTTFANATSFDVPANSVSSPSGNLTPNPNFNGRTDTNLLSATGNTLIVNESKRIQFVVIVTPGANLGPYNNQATATGQDPNGTQVSDLSQNDVNSNPDPDGDGDPTNNNVPTPVSFTANTTPALGVAKEVVSIVPAGEGNLTVTYRIRARNYGQENLTNLQLTENLATTFDTIPFTLPANSVTSPNGDLTPNPNYNGRTNINLLAGTDTLAIGQTKVLNLVVTITPGNQTRTYNNQVQGTAQSPSGQVSDQSQAGINPDPDNDNNPTNNSDSTPLTPGPNLLLVKRITNATRGGVPIGGINFSGFDNPLNDPNANASGWSSIPGGVSGVVRIDADRLLQSGDEVEYTVYYLSNGGQAVTNAKICDAIPEKTTFIPDSFQPGQGILLNQRATNTTLTNASDADQGTFFSRLTPVTSPCPNLSNANGSVFVDLGTLPITSPDNVGFVRFRVKID